MSTVHITEAELARDVHAVLAKVQQGLEVVIEQDHRPVTILRPAHRSGRLVSEILREARQRNSTITFDPHLRHTNGITHIRQELNPAHILVRGHVRVSQVRIPAKANVFRREADNIPGRSRTR